MGASLNILVVMVTVANSYVAMKKKGRIGQGCAEPLESFASVRGMSIFRDNSWL